MISRRAHDYKSAGVHFTVGGRWIDYPHTMEHEGHLHIAFAGGKQSVEVLKVKLADVDAIRMTATPLLGPKASAVKPTKP